MIADISGARGAQCGGRAVKSIVKRKPVMMIGPCMPIGPVINVMNDLISVAIALALIMIDCEQNI